MSEQHKPFKAYSPQQEKFGTWIIRKIGAMQVWVYRATGGRLWNKFLGAQVAILTTVGRKTGQKRMTPLLFIEDGERVVMAGSKGGMSTEPVWLKNVLANPDKVEVQIGANNRTMQAHIATEQEEEKYWPGMKAIYPDFNEYLARTAGVRHIPLVIFDPRTK